MVKLPALLLALLMLITVVSSSCASSIDAFGFDFADFVGRVMNIDNEYESVEVQKHLDWPTIKSYSVTAVDEVWDDEYSVGVFVYTDEDGSDLTAVQLSMDIGSELHHYGKYFDYATDLVYNILYKYFNINNPSEIWLKFHNRLFQYFDEETLRPHSYKRDGLTLTIECTEDYILNIWLE